MPQIPEYKAKSKGWEMGARILLLEDDMLLCEILREYLEENGFVVEHCEDATSALNLAYEKNFDMWILDVKVPKGEDFNANDLPGFSLLKALREAHKTTPCIFITSLSSIQDVQKGYVSGCDDFLKKPFELVELKLRIQTLLKRVFSNRVDEFADLGNEMRFYYVSKILYRGDKPISLTQKETSLLNLLLQNANAYVSQERIFEELWDMEREPSGLSVRTYIKNLRKIIGKERILSSHNKGYCYVCQR